MSLLPTANGTQCTTCNTQPECARGCGFAQGPSPTAWKAKLRPTPAGGSYTIRVRASGLPGKTLVLRRVTFGEVFFCSGQSNMALALEYTFSKPALDKAVAAGTYDHVRLFQYGEPHDFKDISDSSHLILELSKHRSGSTAKRASSAHLSRGRVGRRDVRQVRGARAEVRDNHGHSPRPVPVWRDLGESEPRFSAHRGPTADESSVGQGVQPLQPV